MMANMQTIVTPPVHSPDEHSIVRLFSAQSAEQAVVMQTHLKELFGDAIWLQKPPSLHITLMEIICDTEYIDKTREQYFQDWYASYNETVKEVLGSIEPFDLHFTELLVSQRAIIIKSADSKVLNDIRKALMERTQLPSGTKVPPDITHSTLARFNKPIDLEEARRLTAEISVNIAEHVTEFSLVRDLGPPDFNGTPMQAYTLKRF